MKRGEEQDLLHGPWPSQPEELSGIFGDTWDIFRERRSDGTHGDWVAERVQPLKLTGSEVSAGLVNSVRAATGDELKRLLTAQHSALQHLASTDVEEQ